VAAQHLWGEVARRLRIEVVSAVTCQEWETVSLKLVWPCRNEVFLSGFSRRLHKELVEGLPQNGVRVGLFFDSLAVDLMSELASECVLSCSKPSFSAYAPSSVW